MFTLAVAGDGKRKLEDNSHRKWPEQDGAAAEGPAAPNCDPKRQEPRKSGVCLVLVNLIQSLFQLNDFCLAQQKQARTDL